MNFLGDKLVIGKFCAIARVTFIMNGANHRMCPATTYPFNIMGGGWEKARRASKTCPIKDTVLGNDVWVGERVTFLPGAHVGDGPSSARARWSPKIPAYAVAVGKRSCRVVKMRFDDETIHRLLELRWWDWRKRFSKP